MPMQVRWETDTCCCCLDGRCGYWCLACICPPIVYTTNLQTMQQLNIHSTFCNANRCETLTTGLTYGISYFTGLIGSALAVGPWYYFLSSCILVPVCMQCVTREIFGKAMGSMATYAMIVASHVFVQAVLWYKSPTNLN